MDTRLCTALRGSPTARRSARQSRGDEVCAALREELLNGTVAPWDRLAEERIAAAFGVSRTPVREALARLQAEGLIHKRNGGLYLYLPSLGELLDLYELRLTLELQGIRRMMESVALRHDLALLEPELAAWHELSASPPAPGPAVVTSDERFHLTLLDSAGNPSLTEALKAVNQSIRAARMHDYLAESRVAATISEHIEILELVIGDHLPAACDRLRAHILGSRDLVVEHAGLARTIADRRWVQ